MAVKPTTFNQYLATLPADQAKAVKKVRKAVLAGAPGRPEKIAYGLPAVVLDGQPNLHYGAWKEHIGVYPVLATMVPAKLAKKIEPYRTSKGTLTFKYADGVPYDLIEEIARELSS